MLKMILDCKCIHEYLSFEKCYLMHDFDFLWQKGGNAKCAYFLNLLFFFCTHLLVSHLDLNFASPLFDNVKGGEIIRNEIKTCFTLTLGLRGSNFTNVFVKSL